MTKRTQSKYKIDRRLRVNLWGRPKSSFNKRDYGPGEHGQNSGKPSEYRIQLMEKQKLKGYYGNITEKQFHRTFKEAVRLRGDTAQQLIGLLEGRLDAAVYRLKFVPTVFSARQLVNHGHVLVNGKKVNIPSYLVKEGDVVEVKASSQQIPIVMEGIASTERDVPEYWKLDSNGFKGTLLKRPSLEDVPYPVIMNPNLVVEFYSR
ncbi:MAG: 30S ribosomal protein S4 [Alphaproteobacteria bacterium]